MMSNESAIVFEILIIHLSFDSDQLVLCTHPHSTMLPRTDREGNIPINTDETHEDINISSSVSLA